MNKKILDKFLECGYFIGIPNQKKIFCLIPKLNTSNFECYPSFYLNDFYMSQEKSFFTSDEFYDVSFSNFFDLLNNEFSEKPEIIWDKVEKDYYFNRFSSLKNEIINQRLKKGVPFTFLRGNFLIERKHKVYFIKNLLQNSIPKKEKEKHVEVIDLQFYQSPHQLKLFVLNEESIFYSKSSSVCFKYHFMKTLNQHSKHQL
jgi:hypothetical protein